ncbi:hypothetical protein RHGRI_000867 [Rhododendron griersonianum]|uniref:DNA topoisomerase (ATP-hydrolyzing) n=1 Tax=Rhododendron griersonianum TaxID=479676 RepID=A0AAV6LIH7_9ERIC|nr:hypothetical protein RHGRI_000867 [Rhododendron griersonianum]
MCFLMGTTLYLFLSLQPGTYLDQKEKLIKYSDFVNKELILFSMADLQRSIPSITSGSFAKIHRSPLNYIICGKVLIFGEPRLIGVESNLTISASQKEKAAPQKMHLPLYHDVTHCCLPNANASSKVGWLQMLSGNVLKLFWVRFRVCNENRFPISSGRYEKWQSLRFNTSKQLEDWIGVSENQIKSTPFCGNVQDEKNKHHNLYSGRLNALEFPSLEPETELCSLPQVLTTHDSTTTVPFHDGGSTALAGSSVLRRTVSDERGWARLRLRPTARARRRCCSRPSSSRTAAGGGRRIRTPGGSVLVSHHERHQRHPHGTSDDSSVSDSMGNQPTVALVLLRSDLQKPSLGDSRKSEAESTSLFLGESSRESWPERVNSRSKTESSEEEDSLSDSTSWMGASASRWMDQQPEKQAELV